LNSLLPEKTSRILHISTVWENYLERQASLRNALIASGYLTMVRVAVSNPSGTNRPACDRLWTGTRKTDVKWEINSHSRDETAIEIICRPKDVALCEQLLRQP
jgi:hypothetical protein